MLVVESVYVGSSCQDFERIQWEPEHLAQGRGKPFYEALINLMTSGPLLVQVLEGKEAISRYRKLMGDTNPKKASPGTLRHDFAESIENKEIVEELSLPPIKVHCSVLAEDAIKAAIEDWRSKKDGRED